MSQNMLNNASCGFMSIHESWLEDGWVTFRLPKGSEVQNVDFDSETGKYRAWFVDDTGINAIINGGDGAVAGTVWSTFMIRRLAAPEPWVCPHVPGRRVFVVDPTAPGLSRAAVVVPMGLVLVHPDGSTVVPLLNMSDMQQPKPVEDPSPALG